MANPVFTSRVTPSGFMLEEGYRIQIAFSLNPAIQFWEKSVKSIGVDAGDLIDITTQYNVNWMTYAFRHLKKGVNVTGKAGWDPNVYTALFAMIGFPCSVTIILPTNAKVAFFGGLLKAEPDEMEVGKFPELAYDIGVTNWDYVNYVEAGPIFQAAAGTP